MPILSFISRCSSGPIKIPAGCVYSNVNVYVKTDKLILKFKWNCRKTRTAKTKLRKKKPEDPTTLYTGDFYNIVLVHI